MTGDYLTIVAFGVVSVAAAARIAQKGVSLSRAVVVVVGFAIVARLITFEVMGFQKFGYPYTPTVAAAVAGGIVVVICRFIYNSSLAAR